MELEFQKTNEGFVAEFTAENDFNIHIESAKPIVGSICQKSVQEGKYAVAENITGTGNVLDTDVTALIYPKYIKVVTESQVTNCQVTFAV